MAWFCFCLFVWDFIESDLPLLHGCECEKSIVYKRIMSNDISIENCDRGFSRLVRAELKSSLAGFYIVLREKEFDDNLLNEEIRVLANIWQN